MPSVTLPTIAPYHQVVVNTETIFAAIVDPSSPAGEFCDLLVDAGGGRSILITEAVELVGPKLGADFVCFQAAAVSSGTCFVNRRGWVSVTPHPQVAGVTQIHGHNRTIAVRATLAEVQAALA